MTILAVGTWLAANPGLGRQMLAAGHELGNHTQHHANIKTMKPQLAYAEISACAEAVRAVSGSIGRWFRPSQTQYATPAIKAAARPGSIVSLHCGHEGTVAAIAPLLAGLRARGLRPVTATELLT